MARAKTPKQLGIKIKSLQKQLKVLEVKMKKAVAAKKKKKPAKKKAVRKKKRR